MTLRQTIQAAPEKSAELITKLSVKSKAAERTTREATEKAADTLARGAASVHETARQLTANIKERTEQVASDALDAMTVYSQTSQKILDDLQAVGVSSSISAGAVSEISSVWIDWFGNVARINADASQQFMYCRTVQQVAELQKDFATSAMRSWMERNAKVLEVAQRTWKQAFGPLNGRLSDAA